MVRYLEQRFQLTQNIDIKNVSIDVVGIRALDEFELLRDLRNLTYFKGNLGTV